MGLAELVVGLGQAVALGVAGVALDHLVDHALADGEGDARVVGELVDGLAEDVLGDDPGAAAGGQVGVGGDVGGLDGDVHGAVAHAEDDDVLAGEERVVDVGVGVHLLAGERVGAGEGRFGPARVPVVAVGDEQRVVGARLAAVERDLPGAVLAAVGVLDAGLEVDVRAQAEVVDVVVEVLADVGVVGEVGIGGGHREVRVVHALARDVDEQVAVGGRHPVAVAEHPVAADLVGLLEAVEGDPALVQRLDGGDARGAGADDAGARQRARSAVRALIAVCDRDSHPCSSVEDAARMCAARALMGDP